MGRPRKHRLDLPKRVYLEDGRYRYKPAEGKPVELGSKLGEALVAHSKLVAPPAVAEMALMGEIGDHYMLRVAPLKAPRTFSDNTKEWKNLRPAFAHLLPSECVPTLMYKYMQARGARVRANREKALFSHMLTYAVYLGKAERNPLYHAMNKALINHGERSRTRLVTDKELAMFLRGANNTIADYVEGKEMTGLRLGDMLMMDVTQFVPEGLYVMPRKGRRLDPKLGERLGKERIFPYTPQLEAWRDRVLARKREREIRTKKITPYIFATSRGKCYYNPDEASADPFYSLWQRQMRKAKKAALAEGWTLKHFTEHDIRAKTGTEAERTQGGRGHKLLGNSEAIFNRAYNRGVEVVQPMEKKK